LKYFFSGTAAVVATLVLAGTALANSPSHTSLLPSLAPRADAWLQILSQFPQDPQPVHRAAPKPHAAPQPPASDQQQGSGSTLSLYESSIKPRVLAQQGCDAAHRNESGVVVLDFGKPAYERHGYGTILFSGRFALNHQITYAMLGWARGYVRCLPPGSTQVATLARGTSNYHPAVPSAYTAGLRWARATHKLQWKLRQQGLDTHVTSAAADDAEPAWDRGFRNTRLFIHGFRTAARGNTLYDYGSLDGGVGSIWSAHQAFYVAGGIGNTAVLPEIYYPAQAQEWAELAAIAKSRFHTPVRFAGVMTQGTPSCHCGFRPSAAHRALAHALESEGAGGTVLPQGGTNIVSG
jgi:hypothetical protein